MKGGWSALILGRRSAALDLAPALLYVGVIFYAGLIPISKLPDPGFVPADKFWHLLAFAGGQGLFFRAIHHFRGDPRGANRLALLATSGAGLLLELAQACVPYRSAELLDWVADTLGAALMYGLLALLMKGRTPTASATPRGA